jgi:hypothetical protein
MAKRNRHTAETVLPHDIAAIRREISNFLNKLLQESQLKAVLNEKDIAAVPLVDLPESFRGRIIPDSLYQNRKHPDVRIARRANTIASLARVISERDVSKGLRRTLLTQARRLEQLARQRLDEIEEVIPTESLNEETGETIGQ